MRQVKINRNLILREDGRLFKVRKGISTGEERIPKQTGKYFKIRTYEGNFDLHVLVMKYFGPPKPGPDYMIDHINQNRYDNRIENLRWVTAKENQYNRKDNLPIGHRVCDFNNLTEYSKYYKREKRGKNKKTRT